MCCQRELFSSWVDCCDTATPKASYYCALYTVHPFQFIRHTHRIDTLRQIWSGRFIHASQGMPVREVGDAKYILITHIYIEGWKSGPTDGQSRESSLEAHCQKLIAAHSLFSMPIAAVGRYQESLPGFNARCRSKWLVGAIQVSIQEYQTIYTDVQFIYVKIYYIRSIITPSRQSE